ncbi:hypothetical protein [Parablautia intestinalis]|uniref:hypothetical protein n=1 Tax=Parablautia intestinalis TaxID=2320100 RepID=UPI00259D3111|nr:hypothetical protein [Parablautia intestinalis]
MKISNTNLSQLSKEKSLRNDCVYQRVILHNSSAPDNCYRFSELFNVSELKVSPNELIEDFYYCQIGDVDKTGCLHPVHLNFDNRNLLEEDYYKKIEKGDVMAVEENDIVFSFLLPQDETVPGKFARISAKDSNVLFSKAFLRVQPRVNPEILYYYLKSVFYKKLVASARIRKGYTGYATLSKDDLSDLKFDKAEIKKLFLNASTLTPKITDIENQISARQQNIYSMQAIIDTVFQEEFGYNYDTFEKLKSHKAYHANSASFSNNPDLRFSVKFHRPAGEFVMNELTANTDKKLKHILAEPIVLGASISPAEFDESGNAYYVSMATIKTLEIELDDTQLVSDRYFKKKKDDKSVQMYDIIIARSGVAIGKSAIIKDDFEGIFADFTMRIRIDNTKYNPIFTYYYIRTKYFQYLIEVYKKGLQNQNIFPIVLKEFPIPDIALSEQAKIVAKIQNTLAKQDKIKEEIERLRNQIDETILHIIRE